MEVFTGSLLMVVALFGGCSFIHADPPPVNTSQPSPAPVPVKPPAVATGVLTNRTVRTVMVGGIEAEGHLVFRDEHAWDRFCQKNDLRERPKLVNWDKDIVIVAFMGKIFAKDIQINMNDICAAGNEISVIIRIRIDKGNPDPPRHVFAPYVVIVGPRVEKVNVVTERTER